MITQVFRSALIGIVALLMFLGGLWVFQREASIIKNQEVIAAELNSQKQALQQVVNFINQQIQASQKAAQPDAR